MSRKYQPALLERIIDEQQIAPRRGALYQLAGSGFGGKSMRSYAEAWAAIALLNGEFVHWIDGACRFNPTRIMKCLPSNIPESNNLLHNLLVGRGFTVHQFSALVERVPIELPFLNNGIYNLYIEIEGNQILKKFTVIGD